VGQRASVYQRLEHYCLFENKLVTVFLFISAKVNEVHIGGDYWSFCPSVCVHDDSSSSPRVIHNREERWRPPV